MSNIPSQTSNSSNGVEEQTNNPSNTTDSNSDPNPNDHSHKENFFEKTKNFIYDFSQVFIFNLKSCNSSELLKNFISLLAVGVLICIEDLPNVVLWNLFILNFPLIIDYYVMFKNVPDNVGEIYIKPYNVIIFLLLIISTTIIFSYVGYVFLKYYGETNTVKGIINSYSFIFFIKSLLVANILCSFNKTLNDGILNSRSHL